MQALNRSYLTGFMLVWFLLFDGNSLMKKTGCTYSSVLCLLYYNDVRLVGSHLFHLSNSAVFSYLSELSFYALYSVSHSIIQVSSNFPQTSASSAPSVPSPTVYHSLEKVKVSTQQAPISCITASEVCTYNL